MSREYLLLYQQTMSISLGERADLTPLDAYVHLQQYRDIQHHSPPLADNTPHSLIPSRYVHQYRSAAISPSYHLPCLQTSIRPRCR